MKEWERRNLAFDKLLYAAIDEQTNADAKAKKVKVKAKNTAKFRKVS